MLTTQLFPNIMIAPLCADDLIDFGKRHHMAFEEINDMKGVITEPILKSNFYYNPMEMEEGEIHPEALRRLQLVRDAGFPVTQVIIGHEITEEPPPGIKLPEIPWKNAGKIALGVTAGLVFLPFTIAAIAGLGMVALTVGAIMALASIDPQLIVVLEDGSWVCLFSWED